MKKYLVVGDPIDHSLSPKLHNHWIKENKINAVYEKKKIKENEIKNLISEIKNEKIEGINVTVPFKKKILPFSKTVNPSNSKIDFCISFGTSTPPNDLFLSVFKFKIF